MAAYAWTPSALTWLHVNNLINGLHKQISCKNCLYADNLYFTLATVQINLNLTLARVSLAETRLIFKFARDLVVSARTCVG